MIVDLLLVFLQEQEACPNLETELEHLDFQNSGGTKILSVYSSLICIIKFTWLKNLSSLNEGEVMYFMKKIPTQ